MVFLEWGLKSLATLKNRLATFNLKAYKFKGGFDAAGGCS
jgi:hypothetical protein